MGSIIKVNEYKDFGNNAIITSDGAGVVTPNAAGLKNTPAFEVKKGSDQTVSNNTLTQVTFDTEVIDTDSAFASNTFTVPTGGAGKYAIYANICGRNATDNQMDDCITYIYKNGAAVRTTIIGGMEGNLFNVSASAMLDLAEADAITVYGLVRYDSSGTLSFYSSYDTYFGGYKLIGA